MGKRIDDLATLHVRWVAEVSRGSLDETGHQARWNRKCSRTIARLAKQEVTTIGDLIARLPHLSRDLKQFGIWLLPVLQARQAIPALLELLDDKDVRAACADALGQLKPGKRVTQRLLDIGTRELASDEPDRHWLEAVICGLRGNADPRAGELLLDIFERADLPGWVRGDAGDALGCCWVRAVHDRRTRLFHRCRDAALRGLHDESIDVQFWSMYVIGSLCSGSCFGRRTASSPGGLEAALPKLRQIAANDHRLAPGSWWPMSAEAEDIIHCIETGDWLDPNAAERWHGNDGRGEFTRD
jgi:hypothetical protein